MLANDENDIALLIKAGKSTGPLNYTCVVSGDYVYQALALNYENDPNIINSVRKKVFVLYF